MLTFIQYIQEAGDSHYPFKETPNNPHWDEDMHPDSANYHFKVDGEDHFAFIKHHNARHAEVLFGKEYPDDPFASSYDLTKDKGTKATKVFSTVHNIIRHHVKTHPDVEHITFTSSKFEPTRASLYSKYTKKLGGRTDEYPYETGMEYTHTIPADSYRKTI